MKLPYYILAVCLSFAGCSFGSTNNCSEPIDIHIDEIISVEKKIQKDDGRWIKELEKKYPSKDANKFWFKYDTAVEGYTVCGRFIPQVDYPDLGQMTMRFDNGANVFYYQSTMDNEFASTVWMQRMNLDGKLIGWENKVLYTFHYDSPEEDSLVDGLHPLSYSSPFQFFDINFDGKKELLISDSGMCQKGDKYYTYQIDGNNLIKIETIPIREISTFSIIDSDKKTITINYDDGAANGSVFVFKKGNNEKMPQLEKHPFCLASDVYNEYLKTWDSCGFILVSLIVRENWKERELVLND